MEFFVCLRYEYWVVGKDSEGPGPGGWDEASCRGGVPSQQKMASGVLDGRDKRVYEGSATSAFSFHFTSLSLSYTLMASVLTHSLRIPNLQLLPTSLS